SLSCLRSLTPPEVTADLLNLVGNLEAPQNADAVVVEAEAGRKDDRWTFRNIECDRGAEILRGLSPAKAVAIAEAAIHFHAAGEMFAAEPAVAASRFQGQWAARADGVAELPRLVLQILFSDEVFGEIPAADIARENQFGFDRALDGLACDVVRNPEVLDAVM